MLTYFLEFTTDLFLEVFNNPLLEIVPIIFLFVAGLTFLNMIKNVA